MVSLSLVQTSPNTALEHAFRDAMDRFAALAATPIVREPHLDYDDPDHLEALSKLTKDAAAGLDELFYEIAVAGGLGETPASRSCHRFQISSTLDGNLEFELRLQAEKLREDAPRGSPDCGADALYRARAL